MSPAPHPLAYLAAILWAGAATVAFIGGYVAAVVLVSKVTRWWRGGARRFEKVQRLAALDNAARTPVRRDPLDGIVVSAEFERIAAELHYDSVREMLDDGDADE